MTNNEFQWKRDTTSSGLGSTTVTPSDTADLAEPARGLYIEVAGNVKFNGLDGAADTWAVPANFYLDCVVTRVFASGTTATGIHAIK